MFHFPQPGEQTREALVCLEQREIAALLVQSAMALSAVECPVAAAGDCDNCNATRWLFWSVSNSLDDVWRGRYQRHLATIGIPLPEAPWENVDAQGNPTGDEPWRS